jgi:hypothetical protein
MLHLPANSKTSKKKPNLELIRRKYLLKMYFRKFRRTKKVKILLKKQKNKITRIKQNIFFKKQRTQTKNKKNFSLRKILKKKIKIHGITKRMKDGTEVFLNEKKKHRLVINLL